MNAAAKPYWLLGPVREPVDPDVSKRIDILRLLVICLIIFVHGGRGITVRIGGAAPGAAFMLDVLNAHMGYVSIPLFFAISGFLFLRKFELSLRAYGDMLAKKFVSLLVPYLLFNAGCIAWFYCVGGIEMFGTWNYVVQEGFWGKLLGLGTTPINYPLWFLRDMLLVFLVSPALLLFFKEAPGVGLVTLFLLWIGMSEAPYSLYGNAFAFYLGGYLARVGFPLAGTAWWQRTGGWGFLGFTGLMLFRRQLGITDPSFDQVLFKCYMLSGLLFFWWLSGFPALRDSRLLHRLARHSFFVYLAQEPTLTVLQTRLLTVWEPEGSLQQIAFFWISGLTTIAFLWGVAELLQRFVPAVYRVMTGARRSKAHRPADVMVSGHV